MLYEQMDIYKAPVLDIEEQICRVVVVVVISFAIMTLL